MYTWEHSQQYCVVTDNSSLIVLTILMKCIKTANHYVVHLKLAPSHPGTLGSHLLLGRKVMTNLDSIFKSRDITLPTKVCLVKAMVFAVVMYGCEIWTVKKAECKRIDAFELWC